MEENDNGGLVDRGLEFVRRAIEEDHQHNIHEAICSYNNAISHFNLAMEDDDVSLEIKDVLPSKISEYQERVIQLEAIISNKSVKKTTIPDYILETEKEFDKNKFKTLKRGEASLERALHLANKAKSKDTAKKYIEAFIYYTQALEYFADAAKNAPGGIMVSLNKTMKAYMERAETIKTVLDKYKIVPKVSKPFFPQEEDVSEYHMRMASECQVDGRIGPVTKKLTTSFWNDGRPFFFQVQLKKNIFSPGDEVDIDVVIDNKTGVTIGALRVDVVQFNTTTTIALNGTKKTQTNITIISPQIFKKAFPLSTGTFKGPIKKYTLPLEMDRTEADSSACFAREFELRVQCEIYYHQNVILPFHIRVQ
eukprot:TRINITY_DN22437_c0_g1_i1.p1 TRINITY_DN22437_c0_g1~~TRINITY_DN22437_c0_g1_i1.p1  ORF type:complete len:365 (-),score=106.24 TRINITY_DN22437_c0_g1_i1:10-1104(-)